MNNDFDAANNLPSLDLATLRAWHRDASEGAALCMPDTATHKVRVTWLGKLAAELTRRGH